MAKSTRPTVSIHNIQTDEIIVREYNDAEFAQYQAEKAARETIEAELKAKEAAKLAILDRIGLTADELKTILG
jgi:hypothetical protein